jgi:hypothetical protein
MLVSLILMVIVFSPTYSSYQAQFTLSSPGYEFQPQFDIQLILATIAGTQTICCTTCFQQPSCHTFDYDSASGRCRLFEGDSTTGLIIPATSLTSIVGTVRLSSSLFVGTHNQPCQICQENRYEYCSPNGNTCQCRPHTFWNGTLCLLQLFENDTCTQIDACRADLNLTCNSNCRRTFARCEPIKNALGKILKAQISIFTTREVTKIELCKGFTCPKRSP